MPADLHAFLTAHGFEAVQLAPNALGHFELEASIDGKPVRLLLDTGASHTVLDRRTATHLGLSTSDADERGGGVGTADAATGRGEAQRLDLGRVAIAPLIFYVMDLGHVNQSLSAGGGTPIGGVVGGDILRAREAVIDCARATLYLRAQIPEPRDANAAASDAPRSREAAAPAANPAPGADSAGQVQVRGERSGDRAAVHALNRSAFDTPAEADLVDTLRGEARPLVSLVAERNGTVVGHILFSPVSLSDHPGLRIMGLGPMAVGPQHQRHGIGTALVREGLERCKALGFGAVVVLGHPDYYPRFGFVPSRRFSIGCEYDVPAEVFMVLELEPGYLGGATGTIRYHPAFATA